MNNLIKDRDLELIQKEDGSFGYFHSMSNNSVITTEMVLRRLMFLECSNDQPILKKCITYLEKCLNKELIIPDRREKVINWDVFEELMFSSWLTIFNVSNSKIEFIKQRWKEIIEKSIVNDKFDYETYKKIYRERFGKEGKREINPATFYFVNLLKDVLDIKSKKCYFDFIMNKGIYYIYDKNLYELPLIFDSKNTISYLLAIKFASYYSINKEEVGFVKKWLDDNKKENGWEINNIKPDGIIFPISGNWRNKENKHKDINNFIYKIYEML